VFRIARLGLIAVVFALAAMPANADASLPSAHAGSTCTFGPYRTIGIGLVLGAGPDKRGPAGNEVKDIQRIFFAIPATESKPLTVGFAGWLTSSFDGRFAYTPASFPGESPQTGIGGDVLVVVAAHGDRLPLQSWVTAITQRTHDAPTAALAPLLTAKSVATALSPCFAEPWDGRSMRSR